MSRLRLLRAPRAARRGANPPPDGAQPADSEIQHSRPLANEVKDGLKKVEEEGRANGRLNHDSPQFLKHDSKFKTSIPRIGVCLFVIVGVCGLGSSW